MFYVTGFIAINSDRVKHLFKETTQDTSGIELLNTRIKFQY